MTRPPPLRWGVLGAAWIAERAVLPAIRAEGGAIVALASRDRDRAQALARRFQVARVGDGYQDVLDVPGLDAVYIPLPNSLHARWTIAAAARGLHVLCEKPLADHPDAGRRMVEACAAAPVALAEAVMYRYHPRMEAVERCCRDGELGELRHVAAHFSFPLAPGPNIRWDARLGGGALLDVGGYAVGAARWLLGADPVRVAAVVRRQGSVDVQAAAVLDFATGATASVAVSFQAAEHQRLTVVGTRASLTVPRPFTAWVGEALPLELERDGATTLIPTPAADPYRAMVRAFTLAVRTGAPLRTPGADGVRTLEVLQACRDAAGGVGAG